MLQGIEDVIVARVHKFQGMPFNTLRDHLRSLLTACALSSCFQQTVASPLLYERVHINSVAQLESFTSVLHAADKKWDSIRRIPYSTPGRWVQLLDLSALSPHQDLETHLRVDTLLTRLFPLLPFLAALLLNEEMTLSRRVLESLVVRDGSFAGYTNSFSGSPVHGL